MYNLYTNKYKFVHTNLFMYIYNVQNIHAYHKLKFHLTIKDLNKVEFSGNLLWKILAFRDLSTLDIKLQ